MRAHRVAWLGGVAIALAIGLTACGRKAPNLPPEDSTYPRSYPAPVTPETAPRAPTLPPPAPRDEDRRRSAPPS
ncbi:hypothetical protein [uncultured Rhodospira sp.]|uniref:hypothetical protein n=1 Tax=uncultured Rhodospira sp. TaxID=1936189 RepID=UPI00260FE1A2|nr:hypothetical protein [uncultured Rhodospira sp.]